MYVGITSKRVLFLHSIVDCSLDPISMHDVIMLFVITCTYTHQLIRNQEESKGRLTEEGRSIYAVYGKLTATQFFAVLQRYIFKLAIGAICRLILRGLC